MVHTYGCAPLERGSGGSHLTCNAWRSTHSTPSSIACCYEGNFCNKNITPPGFAVGSDADYHAEDYDPEEGFDASRLNVHLLSALSFLLVGCIIGVSLVFAGYVFVRRWRRHGGSYLAGWS
jgi:Activin types I and II receptor domain